MTLELTMQSMYDAYPALYKERADCLNQLFCVLGNGYGWHGGELVDAPCHGDRDHEPPERAELARLKSLLVDGKAFQHKILTEKQETLLGAEVLGVPVNPDRLARCRDVPRPRRPRKDRWYFRTKTSQDATWTVELYRDYVPLWNVPADVRPDWLAGIAECKAMLLEDGIITREDMATVPGSGRCAP